MRRIKTIDTCGVQTYTGNNPNEINQIRPIQCRGIAIANKIFPVKVLTGCKILQLVIEINEEAQIRRKGLIQ